MSFPFILRSTEFNQDHLGNSDFGTVHWSLVGSPEGTQLKT